MEQLKHVQGEVVGQPIGQNTRAAEAHDCPTWTHQPTLRKLTPSQKSQKLSILLGCVKYSSRGVSRLG